MEMVRVRWVLVVLFAFVSSAKAQSDSVFSQTRHERQARLNFQQKAYQVHLASLRSDPIYSEVLGTCRDGGFKNYVAVALSSAKDAASVSQILLLDVSGLVRFYQNHFLGSKLAYMVSSEAFTQALVDCDTISQKSGRVIAAYYFSDWLGKSTVVVSGAYVVSRGILKSIYQFSAKVFGRVPTFVKYGLGVIGGAYGVLQGANIYQLKHGKDQNTELFESAARHQADEARHILEKVLQENILRRDSLLAELAKVKSDDPEYTRLQENLIYRNMTISELKKTISQ